MNVGEKSIEDLMAMQVEWDELLLNAVDLVRWLKESNDSKEQKMDRLKPELKELIFRSTELTIRCGMDLNAVKDALFGEKGALIKLTTYDPGFRKELDEMFEAAVAASNIKV